MSTFSTKSLHIYMVSNIPIKFLIRFIKPIDEILTDSNTVSLSGPV